MTLYDYYKKLKSLRYAKDIVEDIDILQQSLNEFDEHQAKQVITYITNKYTKQLDEIGDVYSNLYVIEGKYEALYKDTTTEDIIEELEYLVNCLIVIGCVQFKFENSYLELINKLQD